MNPRSLKPEPRVRTKESQNQESEQGYRTKKSAKYQARSHLLFQLVQISKTCHDLAELDKNDGEIQNWRQPFYLTGNKDVWYSVNHWSSSCSHLQFIMSHKSKMSSKSCRLKIKSFQATVWTAKEQRYFDSKWDPWGNWEERTKTDVESKKYCLVILIYIVICIMWPKPILLWS